MTLVRPPASLQERKRRWVRAEAAALAVGVWLERGYEESSLDDLAEAAGISRRTFFRYFGTKEGVVRAMVDNGGANLVEAFVAQPPEEAPLVSLRRAMVEGSCVFTRDAPLMRRLILLTLQTPVLRAQVLDRHDHWRAQLALEVARRMRAPAACSMQPRLIAAIAMGAMDVAISHWAEHDGLDLGRLIEESFDSLGQVLGPPRGARGRLG